ACGSPTGSGRRWRGEGQARLTPPCGIVGPLTRLNSAAAMRRQPLRRGATCGGAASARIGEAAKLAASLWVGVGVLAAALSAALAAQPAMQTSWNGETMLMIEPSTGRRSPFRNNRGECRSGAKFVSNFL